MILSLLLALSVSADCQASADLHRVISGGQDGVYAESLEACTEGLTYTEWLAYEPTECEELAGEAYDRTGDPATYESTLAACETGAP